MNTTDVTATLKRLRERAASWQGELNSYGESGTSIRPADVRRLNRTIARLETRLAALTADVEAALCETEG